MDMLAEYDFMTGVNPTIKTVVYVLILIHILAVTIWCVLACPQMWKKSDSFSDKVENSVQSKLPAFLSFSSQI